MIGLLVDCFRAMILNLAAPLTTWEFIKMLVLKSYPSPITSEFLDIHIL